MYSSMSFSKFIRLFNLHHILFLEHIPYPKFPPACLPLVHALLPDPITNLLSVSTVLPFLEISYKWNWTMQSLEFGFIIPISVAEET